MSGPSHQRVTMRMIAEKLGVTKTTVSLALRGHKSIPEKTRQRVVKTANELNYRPDPAISAIAAQRWSGGSPDRHHVIAFPCNRREEWKGVQFEYYAEALQRAKELGYRLETFYVDDYPTGPALSKVLQNRGIRGILVPPILNPESKRTMQLDWDKFTAVCCGVGRIKPPLHTVTCDYFETTRRLWKMIKDLGYQRIGAAISGHNPIADDDWHRIGASLASLFVFGLSEAGKIPFLTSHVQDEEALMRWYEKYRPEVIIGFNMYTGQTLERHGVRIPEDVEFASIITSENSKWTGFVQQTREVAHHAMDMLANEIRENRWGFPNLPNLILVNPQLNRGETLLRYPEEIRGSTLEIQSISGQAD